MGDSSDNGVFSSHISPRKQESLILIVGKKCLVECYLNHTNSHVLWDTGAMVSIMSQAFLDKYLPDTESQYLESLLGYGAELKLTAANGTQISYIGWAVVKFELKASPGSSHACHQGEP